MKPKQLIILLVLLAAAGAWVFVANKGRQGDNTGNTKNPGDRILPELAVSSIGQIKLTGPEKSVVIKSTDAGKWVVAEREDYPADANKIRKIVLDVSTMKVSQTQKVGESQVGRLGLAAPDAEGELETRGTRLELLKADGSVVASVLLGKEYTPAEQQAPSGESTRGRYVMTGAGEAYVVSNVFWYPEADPKDWLNRESFSVQSAKSLSVDAEGDTDDYRLVREEEGGEPALTDKKDDENLDAAAAGSAADAFSSASFVDVLTGDGAKDEITGLDKPTKVNIETFEGFKYEILVGKKGDSNRYPIKMTVSADIAQERTPEADEKEEDKASRDEAFTQKKTRLTEKLEKEKRLEGKIFLVESFVVQNVLKKRSELMAAKEEPKEGDTPNGDADGFNIPSSLEAPKEVPMETITKPAEPIKKITAVTPPISIQDAIKKDEAKKDEAMKEDAKPVTEPTEAEEKAGDDAAKVIEEPSKAAVEQEKTEDAPEPAVEGDAAKEGGE
jgi:hypothetical protein